MTEAALEVRGLTAGYAANPIVIELDLVARAGQVTVVVGPNGAGKSTMAKAIAGIIRPLAGEVRVSGVDVAGQAAEEVARAGLGYVPQVLNVFPSLTVKENLEMGAYLQPRRERPKLIARMLDLFPDLQPCLHRPARTLSGGQRGMLASARGLMAKPSILVLDEPTAGLAPRYEAGIWDHIITMKDAGVAVVVIDQNTRLALSHADWAYVLVVGRKRLEGTGAAVLDDATITDLYIGGR